ncbi:tetratricopeptide repeat protein [Prochlorococcus marinus]|uniref:tetratricopeptide repeat protein n=1 Tax=Prochlorococcus marinus TaxID=1219 RepID=UPI0022B3027A|nr:tetratricopeptide repeat protein [Prochlorococcus marinus]
MKGFGEKHKSKKKNNKKIKVSKEQIINQAIQFHLKGNIPEATKCYQYCINQGFNDHRVFYNYGIISQGQGKSKKAEVLYRKAIEIKPDFADAHYNLANLLQAIGKLQEGEVLYRKAIQIQPDYAEAHLNLGNILRDLGKLQDAELSYRKAIEIKPDYADAHYNLGNILRDLGKLKEAELSTRKAIEIQPDYAEAYSNLGNILRDLGKLQEAEISYRKAIEIKPDYAEAHYNLGNILRDLGNLQEAEISYRKAIEIKPDYAEAHSNLGVILNDLGKLQEAEISYRKAIEIKPDYAEAHYNLGNILNDIGKSQEAFDSYLKSIDINPKLYNIYASIARLLKDSDPSQLNQSKLKHIINLLLEKNDISHKELTRAFNFIYSNEIIISLEKIDSDFSRIELLINDKVIINALKKIIFCDAKLEESLTKIRRNICDIIAKNTETINYSALQFIIALGEQCFLNEYVYSVTEEEKASLETIIKRCQDDELSETNISVLSCYFPLYKLLNRIPSLKSFISSNQSFNELMTLQITDPLKEIKLSKNIKKLGSINDDISQKVKSQYEEHPYPRWRYSSHQTNQKISIIQAINTEINPNYIRQSVDNNQLKVLIAGCGTGNQILQTQRYKNAQIIAIDLSLSSLSYAQRKINELKIDNVELIQMDILEVSLLEEQFDIIECGGVLHHMNDPSQGLKTLLGSLKDNGFLKLGLYSELARQDIIKARNYISSKKLQTNEDNIRDFRQKIISGALSELKSFKSMGDFYSLSEFRDLCFHAAEHRFTINQLQETLKSNELEFLGFLLPKPVKSLYKQYFPEDKKQTNLQNWEKFEEKQPHTFIAMYQFWVSKTEN